MLTWYTASVLFNKVVVPDKEFSKSSSLRVNYHMSGIRVIFCTIFNIIIIISMIAQGAGLSGERLIVLLCISFRFVEHVISLSMEPFLIIEPWIQESWMSWLMVHQSEKPEDKIKS